MLEKKQENGQSERAVGRRKTAAARVRIEAGSGIITVNDKPLQKYFSNEISIKKILAPMIAAGRENQLNISVRVSGGGITGQAEAVRHGIARALVQWNPDTKPILRAEGFLTRDPRAKERKKPGLRKARRGHQWRKR